MSRSTVESHSSVTFGQRDLVSKGGSDPDLAAAPRAGHIAWFDYAKGICIMLVVMMHSTLGVGEAFAARGLAPEGFMHWVVAYAKPFRMPDFFMLAGLFLSYAIGRGWLHYLDKKVVHFAYFYVLWTIILATVKTAATTGLDAGGLATTFFGALVTPYPTLWFIYVLPLYFVVTKLLHGVPAAALLFGAAVLHTLPVDTGWSTLDHFAAHYYVFFLGGYLLAPHIFAIADWAARYTWTSIVLIAAWAILNGWLAFTPSPINGWQTVADLPLVSIALGGMGAMAIVLLASLLSKFNAAPFIKYCGANSIVLYISFTIPMAFTRVILLKLGVITDTGVAALLVWLVALCAPLIVHAVLRHTPLRLLYERPAWATLAYNSKRTPGGSHSATALAAQ
ncbi:MAG: acyltransferase family protein [Hyphomicrobiaceae bacterium]